MKVQSEQLSEHSTVTCDECGDPIPWKRIKAIPTAKTCVGCMEDLEAAGLGTKKHKISYHIQIHGDDIESIETEIVRANKKE